MHTVKKILYAFFNEDAILSAAICEQADDYAQKDDSKTFNKSNINSFRKEVKEFLSDNPQSRMFEGLSDKERYAFRYFYYNDTY